MSDAVTSLEKIKEYSELKAYSDAQTKTIIELSKKLKIKEDENLHLKKLLESSVPLIKEKRDLTKFESNDQEYICRTEINKLKDLSMERELTLEEVKKLDIYSKILKELANIPKTIEVKSRNYTEAELLAAAESDKK